MCNTCQRTDSSSSTEKLAFLVITSPNKYIELPNLAWKICTSTFITSPEAAFSPIVPCITDEVSLLDELFQKPFPILPISRHCMHKKRLISINLYTLHAQEDSQLWYINNNYHCLRFNKIL